MRLSELSSKAKEIAVSDVFSRAADLDLELEADMDEEKTRRNLNAIYAIKLHGTGLSSAKLSGNTIAREKVNASKRPICR